jgi:Putative peptidoglycan binding domain
MKLGVLIGIGSLAVALTATAQNYNQPQKRVPQRTIINRAYRSAAIVRPVGPQRTLSDPRFRQPSFSTARPRESAFETPRIQPRLNTSFMDRSVMRRTAVPRTPRPAVSDYSAGFRLRERPRSTTAFPNRSEVGDIATRRQVRPASERNWMESRSGEETHTSRSLLKPFTMTDSAARRPSHPEFNNRWATTYFKGQTRNSFVNRSGAATAAIREQSRAAFNNNWRGDSFAGRQYGAFRNYQPHWHDSGWWRHNCDRIVFVTVYSEPFPFYFDAGYWYPAWGYYADAYYPYDGPIYGYNDLPPDEIIANVQIQLYNDGYYDGPIDGILGPDTRAAIADYQADNGLAVTAAVDEPTVEALGLV